MNLIVMAVILTWVGLSQGARADTNKPGFVFICHKGLHYNEAEMSFAFKGYLDEPRPVDNRKLKREMLKYIGYTEAKYHKIWDKMYFRRGLFQPKTMADDAEVIQWVAASYGGVGYVSQAPANNPNVEVCGQ